MTVHKLTGTRDIDLKDIIVKSNGGMVYIPNGDDWGCVVIPQRLQDHVLESVGSDRLLHVVDLAVAVRSLVETLSPMLNNLFGTNSPMITNSTAALLGELAVEVASDKELNEAAFNIYDTLRSQHAEHSLTRRRELVPRLFSDATALQVELMGWMEFIKSKKANLLDSRYNAKEKSPEYLFEYKRRLFLVAKCRTGKVVVLPVGEKVKSCEEAQAWIAGDTVGGLVLPKIHCIGRH